MRHNLTQLNLLRNKDFYFVNKNDVHIYFKVPTLEDFIIDDDMQTFLGILNMKWQELELNTKIDNVYELVLFMAFNGLQTEAIAKTLDKFIVDLTVKSNGMYVNQERLTLEEFMFLADAWLVAIGAKQLESIGVTVAKQELDPIAQRMKENEEKIKKIKDKKPASDVSEKLELDKAIIAVIKEFNQSMEQVMKMNIYTILWYYNYALKLNNYRIETIAYGNGLIKKHRYFIE